MHNLEEFIFYGKIFNENELFKLLKCASSSNMERRTDSTNIKDISLQKGNRNVSFNVNLKNFNYDKIIQKYILNLSDEHKPHFNNLFFFNEYFIDDKITRYDKSDGYMWHTDFNVKTNGVRCLSTITYLNDNYDGGETQFINKTIQPKKGNTLIFPSCWTFPHQGNLVTSGSKLIYVCHFWISPKKTNKINFYLPAMYS